MLEKMFVPLLFVLSGVIGFVVFAYVLIDSNVYAQLRAMPYWQRFVATIQLFMIGLFLASWVAGNFGSSVGMSYKGRTVESFNGKFYVEDHGRRTEVGRRDWQFLKKVEFWCGSVSGVASIVSAISMLALHSLALRNGWGSGTQMVGEPSDAPKDRASRFYNGNHNAGPR